MFITDCTSCEYQKSKNMFFLEQIKMHWGNKEILIACCLPHMLILKIMSYAKIQNGYLDHWHWELTLHDVKHKLKGCT